jgi:hypothetical protein
VTGPAVSEGFHSNIVSACHGPIPLASLGGVFPTDLGCSSMHLSMAHCASLGTTQRANGQVHLARGQCRSTTLPRARRLHLQAMQSGWNQQQQQPQQPMQPMQPMQPQQQQQMVQPQRQPMPLARSPTPYQAAGPVFLELTQVRHPSSQSLTTY